MRKFQLFFHVRYIGNEVINISINPNERSEEIDQLCIKCGRGIPFHPSTGRFHKIVLHGRECAWNPDNGFKDFVINTLKSSGSNIEEFGHKA